MQPKLDHPPDGQIRFPKLREAGSTVDRVVQESGNGIGRQDIHSLRGFELSFRNLHAEGLDLVHCLMAGALTRD